MRHLSKSFFIEISVSNKNIVGRDFMEKFCQKKFYDFKKIDDWSLSLNVPPLGSHKLI